MPRSIPIKQKHIELKRIQTKAGIYYNLRTLIQTTIHAIQSTELERIEVISY